MSIPIESFYQKPCQIDLIPYTRPIEPPLSPDKLYTDLFVGESRQSLRIHTTGDWSLVVGYKGRVAHVTSISDEGDDLSIVQFQGAKGRIGYRVATGFRLMAFVANQLLVIANHPESRYERISMPNVSEIKGIEDVDTETSDRYEELAKMLGLDYSKEEGQYVRDLRKRFYPIPTPAATNSLRERSTVWVGDCSHLNI